MPTLPAAAWLCLALCTAAFAADDYCPASLKVGQRLEDAPTGFVAGHIDSPVQLSGITFFSGPPSEHASLVYDSWTKHNGLAYARWTFPADDKYPIWLSCRYSNTIITLDEKLPAGTSECDVTYDPKVQIAGEPQVQKIACK